MRTTRVALALLALGVLGAHGTASSFSGSWTQTTNRSGGLRDAAQVYDPIRNRMLVFGGIKSTGVTNELWSLDLASQTWTQINVAPINFQCQTKPGGRSRASLFFDPQYDQLILFGGYEAPANDFWTLDLSVQPPQWCKWNPSATGAPFPATASIDIRAVYDTARHRLLVISPVQGVFAIGIHEGVWSQIYTGRLSPDATQSPHYIGAYGYSAVYDSNADRLLIFGGYQDMTTPDDCSIEYGATTVYSLPLGTPNAQFQPIGGPVPNIGVADGGVVFDADDNRLLLYGGERCRKSGSLSMTSQVFGLNLDSNNAVWAVVSGTGATPPNRYAHSVMLAPNHDLYVFGGMSSTGALLSDTYYFRPFEAPQPERRARHIAVYDPNGQQMIMWGGDDGQRRLFRDDVWTMDLRPGMTPGWTKHPVTGTIPQLGTRGAAAVFDTRQNAVIVHGGSSSFSNTPTSSLFKLSLNSDGTAQWSELLPEPGSPGDVPSARMFHSMVYHADTTFLFGGWNGSASFESTYIFTSSYLGPGYRKWTKIQTPVSPEPRYGHMAFFDTPRGRFTVLGGNGSQYETSVAPVWGLTHDAQGNWSWNHVYSYGGPPNLHYATATYQEGQNRAYLNGGWYDYTYQWTNEQTWIYWLFDDPQWQSGWGSYLFTGAPTNMVYQHTAVYDPVGNRLIRFGGVYRAGPGNFSYTDPPGSDNVINLSYQLTLPSYVYDSVWSQIATLGTGTVLTLGGGGGGGSPHPKKYVTASLPSDESNGGRPRLLVSGGLGSSPVRFLSSDLAHRTPSKVAIYDVQGRLVRTLEGLEQGALTWNRQDARGNPVAPGIYLYRAELGLEVVRGKLALTR